MANTIDLVCAKAWYGKNWNKVATASSLTIVYEKSDGKSTKRSIAKTFHRWNNSPCSKYVIYFYPVTYFIPVLLYLSARFLRISIKTTFCRHRMCTFFVLKKWWLCYFDDVIKRHVLVRTWSIIERLYERSNNNQFFRDIILTTISQMAYLCTKSYAFLRSRNTLASFMFGCLLYQYNIIGEHRKSSQYNHIYSESHTINQL